MRDTSTRPLAETIRDAVHPITRHAADYEPLLELVGDALAGSYEALFNGVGVADFVLPLYGGNEVVEALRPSLLERAIGVIYRPETERLSHYFHASLPEQFNAVIHLNETRAVEPLEPTQQWHAG
jgi:erythromycin esterase-like protein